MTYRTLEEIERFTDRLTAEQVAQDYVAAERIHCERVREAITEIRKGDDAKTV